MGSSKEAGEPNLMICQPQGLDRVLPAARLPGLMQNGSHRAKRALIMFT